MGKHSQSSEAQGLVTFCSETGFHGSCQTYNAWVTCIDYISSPSSSLIQDEGAVCDYHQSRRCTGGAVPFQIDSTGSKMLAQDLGDWSGKTMSVICEPKH
jgi:hypothetical protein